MKPRVIIFFIVLSLSFFIPFILQKNIYPFYRYGMFAEPITTNFYEEFEVFIVYNNKTYPFNPKSVGLYNSVFKYLLRNHYYRNQADEFLRVLAKNQRTDSRLYMIRKYNPYSHIDSIKIITDTVATLKIESLIK